MYHAHKCKNAKSVGILTFISMMTTTSGSSKARKVLLHFSFYERVKFRAQLS